MVVPTKNEELAIQACLEGLEDFAEVIVLDSDSTDKTQEIARRLGAQVKNFTWNRGYPKKKQWALENLEVSFPWVLFIDADERPSKPLVDEIRRLISGDPADAAYDIPLEYRFSGQTLNHGHRVVKRCLMRRDLAHFPEIDDLAAPGMGEQEGHYQPKVTGSVGSLRSVLIHDDPDPLSSWVARHNRYSDWEAYLRLHPSVQRQVRGLRTPQGALFDRVPGKPLVFFLYSYVVRAGWRDGRAGLDYALALAFYYWLIDAKVREGKRQRLGSAAVQ